MDYLLLFLFSVLSAYGLFQSYHSTNVNDGQSSNKGSNISWILFFGAFWGLAFSYWGKIISLFNFSFPYDMFIQLLATGICIYLLMQLIVQVRRTNPA
jgi:cell division protein FtsW (lipid II flippase)